MKKTLFNRRNATFGLILSGVLAIGFLFLPQENKSSNIHAEAPVSMASKVKDKDSLKSFSDSGVVSQNKPIKIKPVAATSNMDSKVLSLYDSTNSVKSEWTGQYDAALQGRTVELDTKLTSKELFDTDETVTLELFDGKQIEATVRHSSKNVNGTVTTRAKIKGSEWGTVFIASTQGQVHARIRVPEENRIYSIEFNPETGKHHVLDLDPIKAEPPFKLVAENDNMTPPPTQEALNPSKAEMDLIQNNDNITVSKEHTALGLAISDDNNSAISLGASANINGQIVNKQPDALALNGDIIVDLMMVYTYNVLQAAGSKAAVENNLALAVAFANETYENSRSGFRMRLVHSYQTNHNESGMSNDLNWLWKDAGVAKKRDEHGADFVQMVVKNGAYAGLGWLLDNTNGEQGWAFSIVHADYLAGHVSVHEIGHNMGAHHHNQQSSEPGPTNWRVDGKGFGRIASGWRWNGNDGAKYCSIMTYASGRYHADGVNCTIVPVLSDPGYIYKGARAGDNTFSDNARVLRELAPIYSAYKANVNGDDGGNNGDNNDNDGAKEPNIIVSYPNGGETLNAGNSYKIRWNSKDIDGNVKLELLQYNQLNTTITKSTTNDGSYNWTVPANLSGSDYSIRISDQNTSVTDTSDANFLITLNNSDEEGTNEQKRYEAEYASHKHVKYRNKHSGYSGTGYADYIGKGNGGYIEWQVDAPSNKSADLTFTYALRKGIRNLSIMVNGKIVAPKLSFRKTGSWITWKASETVTVPLKEGSNTIRATETGRSGPNIDYLNVNFNSDNQPMTYEVSYDGNGHTSGTVPRTQTKNKDINLILSQGKSLKRTGYNFLGWNSKPSGTGTYYGIGSSYSANTSLTLYAQWEVANRTYTVRYKGNGHTSGYVPSSQTKNENINLVLASAGSMTRTGYKFEGWNTSAYGNATTYTAGSLYKANVSMTLYAQWSVNGCGNNCGNDRNSSSGNKVISIDVSTNQWSIWYQGTATVKVADKNGMPLSGAYVSGKFTGDYPTSWSAYTDASGKAVMLTGWSQNIKNLTFCVTNIWSGNKKYVASQNVETCDSL